MPASQAGRRRFDPGRPLQNSLKHRPKKSRSYRAVNLGPLPLDLKSTQNVPSLHANSPSIFGFRERVAPMLIPATVLAAVTERFAVVSSHSGSIRYDSPSV